MKGTDVTPEQIERARNFLIATGNNVAEKFSMELDTLLRILAWYGELVKNGDGSGNWVVNRRESNK